MFTGHIEPKDIVMDREAILRFEPWLKDAVEKLSDRELQSLPTRGNRTPMENAMVTAARIAQAAKIARG